MQIQAGVSIGMDQEPIHLYYTVCFTTVKDFEALEGPDSFISSRIISKTLPVGPIYDLAFNTWNSVPFYSPYW